MVNADFIVCAANGGFVSQIIFPQGMRCRENADGRLCVSLSEGESRMLYHHLGAVMADSAEERNEHYANLKDLCWNSEEGVWDGSLSASVL